MIDLNAGYVKATKLTTRGANVVNTNIAATTETPKPTNFRWIFVLVSINVKISSIFPGVRRKSSIISRYCAITEIVLLVKILELFWWKTVRISIFIRWASLRFFLKTFENGQLQSIRLVKNHCWNEVLNLDISSLWASVGDFVWLKQTLLDSAWIYSFEKINYYDECITNSQLLFQKLWSPLYEAKFLNILPEIFYLKYTQIIPEVTLPIFENHKNLNFEEIITWFCFLG